MARSARAPVPPFIRFDEVVALLGLEPLLARRTHQLSGGERQRVALGRALLSQPRLLLLDEPLASVDVARREEVLPYLEALRDRLAIPMVYVSHQFEEVLRLATHLVLLEARRGARAGYGGRGQSRPAAAAHRRPRPRRRGARRRRHAAGCRRQGSARLAVGRGTLQISLRGVPLGARVRLQVLARDVILATQPVQGVSVRNALAGTVLAVRADEFGVLVTIDVGGALVLARITQGALEALNLRPGMPPGHSSRSSPRAATPTAWARAKGAVSRPEGPARSPS